MFLGWDAGIAEAGGVERAQSVTNEEVPRLPIVFVDEVWRAVAKGALHARRPQVGGVEHVGIG